MDEEKVKEIESWLIEAWYEEVRGTWKFHSEQPAIIAYIMDESIIFYLN